MATTLAELILNGVWYWYVRACLLENFSVNVLPLLTFLTPAFQIDDAGIVAG